ncbi:MAG: hypothetical protein GY725_17475 [bacterium]|nr:hypothetical protein [bacterium]
MSNWAECDRALVRRGDITLWISPDAADSWTPGPSGERGGQQKFSDQAIETALALWLVFNLPLRRNERPRASHRGQHRAIHHRRR